MRKIFFLLITIILFSCNESTVENNAEDLCNNTEIKAKFIGKYIIDNEYGIGSVFIKEDMTYEHSFITADSAFNDRNLWWYKYSEKERVYKISFNNWKWHYKIFEHIDSEEERINVMIFKDDRLSAMLSNEIRTKYDYVKDIN